MSFIGTETEWDLLYDYLFFFIKLILTWKNTAVLNHPTQSLNNSHNHFIPHPPEYHHPHHYHHNHPTYQTIPQVVSVVPQVILVGGCPCCR
jgi:hypothetical protein